MSGRTDATALVAVLLAIAATCALGVWQVERGEQKEAMQEVARSAGRATPTAFASIAAGDAPTLIGRHVRLDGHWNPGHVVYLDNRPHDGQPGFYVVMALVLGSGDEVLVDRGWLPRDASDRTRIAPHRTPEGPVEVVGVAAAGEPRLLDLGQAGERRLAAIWQNFDFDAYERVAGTKPPRLIVRQDPTSGDPSDGLVRETPDAGGDLQGQIDRHHGYAFQWFAMAAGLAGYLTYRLVRRRRARLLPA
jgi:surfeit locus 1 family protein